MSTLPLSYFPGGSTTTDATPTFISAIPIPSDQACVLKVSVVSVDISDTGKLSSYHTLEGLFKNTAGVAEQVDAPSICTYFAESGYALDGDSIELVPAGSLIGIRVTGLAGETIRWTSETVRSSCTGIY